MYRLLDPAWQAVDANGNPYSGAKLFVYTAGSSTKETAYQDAAGSVAHSNPITLNSAGRLPDSTDLYVTTGTKKLVLAPSTDSDPPAAAIWSRDNLTAINDITTASAASEWVASGLTPTYVGATSFTLAGDQRTEFHVGRRIQTTNSGGTIYSTITASSYSAPDTTVTVRNDSGTLDSGLSAVSYGILRRSNPSSPAVIPLREGTAVASASTLTPTLDGHFFHVTGTTTITAIDSSAPTPLFLVFDGALTITHNATSMILPGGMDILTAADDCAVFVHEGGSNWRCLGFLPRAVTSATQATTSGTTKDFTIPPWATQITVTVVGLSTNGSTNVPQVQLGDAGGIETSGYLSSVYAGGTPTAGTGGFRFAEAFAAATVLHGALTLTRHGTDGLTWVAAGLFAASNSPSNIQVAGSKTLSERLTTVRLTLTGTPTDAFDAGSVAVRYS